MMYFILLLQAHQEAGRSLPRPARSTGWALLGNDQVSSVFAHEAAFLYCLALSQLTSVSIASLTNIPPSSQSNVLRRLLGLLLSSGQDVMQMLLRL